MALERAVLRDRIKDLVIERILDGTYTPGERLVEMTIAHELGTSQAPVREALRDLQALRFIESVPYRGARVRLVTAEELTETYPVRATLEELAGRLAATSVTDQLLGDLREELRAMRACAEAGDVHEQLGHDVRFHELVVEAAGNRVLLETWRALRIEARTLVSVLAGETDLRRVADSHEPILRALEAGDPDAAGQELRQHIEMYGRGLLARLP